MPQVLKRRRLVNPASRKRRVSSATRKRRMTPKQIKYFGTTRQRAALKAKRRKPARKAPVRVVRRKARKRTVARRKNVGEIITIGLNPAGERKSMAVRRKRRKATAKRRPYRARRRSNPVARTQGRRRVVRRRSVKRRNPIRRRRNQAMLTGTFRDVLGVIGGAAATKLITDRLPYNLAVGPVGYLSTAVVALVLGYSVGKLGKNKPLGDKMMLGGLTYLGLRLLQDFVPGIAAISPIGLRGMGVIGPSSFYTPQVPQRGSMTSFVPPSALMAATSSLQGVGINRRFARVR